MIVSSHRRILKGKEISGGSKDQDRRQLDEGENPLPSHELSGILPCSGQPRQPDHLVRGRKCCRDLDAAAASWPRRAGVCSGRSHPDLPDAQDLVPSALPCQRRSAQFVDALACPGHPSTGPHSYVAPGSDAGIQDFLWSANLHHKWRGRLDRGEDIL